MWEYIDLKKVFETMLRQWVKASELLPASLNSLSAVYSCLGLVFWVIPLPGTPRSVDVLWACILWLTVGLNLPGGRGFRGYWDQLDPLLRDTYSLSG